MEGRSNGLQMLAMAELEPNKGQIEGLPANPRSIKKSKFEKLKRSIETYPEMLAWRSLLVYPHGGKYVIIGGNMRYRAMKELGHAAAPCYIIPQGTTPDRLQAYAVLDNNGFGEWDWDMLANEWDAASLIEWGIDVPDVDKEPLPVLEEEEFKIEIKCDSEDLREELIKEFKGRGLECKKK